jgi:hypothetical protein
MTNSQMSTRRWLDWRPATAVTAESADREPTKPSKPGSVGFEGSGSEDSPKIETTRGAPLVDCAAPPERPMSWSEWKAAALNRLFREYGTSGQPGRITAETVRHGECMEQLEQRRKGRVRP